MVFVVVSWQGLLRCWFVNHGKVSLDNRGHQARGRRERERGVKSEGGRVSGGLKLLLLTKPRDNLICEIGVQR